MIKKGERYFNKGHSINEGNQTGMTMVSQLQIFGQADKDNLKREVILPKCSCTDSDNQVDVCRKLGLADQIGDGVIIRC